MTAVFINPFTDYGFKKLFGEEASKPFLMDFLNSILPEKHQIADLTLKNSEQMGLTDFDRKAIYDIYCENDKGEKFIVELQRAKQRYFKNRTLYYATFPITEQAQQGEWDYNLKAVYCISILDFLFDEHRDDDEVIYTVQLKDQNNAVFSNKLTLIYLQMPNFNRNENELVTKLDKWLFFIKNLEDLQYIPAIFNDSIIEKAFAKAKIANFNRTERDKYQQSLKDYWDYANTLDNAKLETALDIARNLKSMNIPFDIIQQSTQLPLDTIENL